MGTDIHPAVEVRRNGIWRYHRPTTLCRWYAETWDDPDAVAAQNKRREEYIADLAAKGEPSSRMVGWPVVKLGDRRNLWDRCKYKLPEFFGERNYRVFALLGNVRNGSGFAGVYTHDPIESISSERGRPADISKEAEAKLSNEHSDGWATLAELKAYDYRQEIVEGGVISEDKYLEFLNHGRKRPDSWSGGISGSEIVTLTEDEFLSTFESVIDLFVPINEQKRVERKFNRPVGMFASRGGAFTVPDPTKRVYIQAVWKAPLYDEVRSIPEEWIPYLERLVPKGGTDEDVRVVFDFDS